MMQIRLSGLPSAVEAGAMQLHTIFRVRRESADEPDQAGEGVRRYFDVDLNDHVRLTVDESTLLISLLTLYRAESTLDPEDLAEVEALANKLDYLGRLAVREELNR